MSLLIGTLGPEDEEGDYQDPHLYSSLTIPVLQFYNLNPRATQLKFLISSMSPRQQLVSESTAHIDYYPD